MGKEPQSDFPVGDHPLETPPAPGAEAPEWDREKKEEDLPVGQPVLGQVLSPKETMLYKELQARLKAHSRAGKKLHGHAKRCMVVIVVLGTATSVSIATDYFPSWVLAAASGIVAVCGALMGTMKFEENSAWRYEYCRKLKACLYDLVYRKVAIAKIVDKVEALSEEMAQSRPGFGRKQ